MKLTARFYYGENMEPIIELRIGEQYATIKIAHLRISTLEELLPDVIQSLKEKAA